KRTFSARGDAVVAHAPSRLTSAITARLMVLCLSRVFFIVPFPCSVFFVDRVILSFHFFAAGAGVPEEDGVTERVGGAATWTVVPVVRESDGLTITLSDSVTPLRISDCTPKSRPTLTSRSWTTPLASTTPTWTLFSRNMSVLSGKVTNFPKATCGTRTVA